MSDCLSKQTILQFLSDEVAEDNRQQIVDHIEHCEQCQLAMEEALEKQTLLTSAKDSTVIPGVSSTQSESRFSQVSSSLGHRKQTPSPIDMIPPGELPVLEGFEMVGEIGRGASGVVFEAIDKGPDRRVAVKIIAGQLFSQSDLQQRFLREARSVALLNHPNIAQLYQISEVSKYGPYLVFELVDAESLDEIVHQRGALNPRRAVEICRGITAAAQHAHDNNVVHRDLKPSNILIEKNTDVPKVIDFGLAVDPEQQSRLTLDSFIAGTPAYMSPEQIETPRDIEHASDIYSLGVILYEMLTGDVPFRGLSKQTLSRVVNEEPQPLTKLNPSIPKDLETICLKMLSKTASQRYQSMREVDAELLRWQQGRPILAKPVAVTTRAYRWMLRNPLVASLAAIAASLLLIIGIGSTIGVVMLSSANALTRAAKGKSDRSAATAIQQRDQLLETIDSLVYKVNDDVDLKYMQLEDVQIRMLQVALGGLKRSSHPEESKENFEVKRRIGDINLRLASVLGRQQRYDEASDHLADAHHIASELIKDAEAGPECFLLRSQASWEQVNLDALTENLEQAEIDLLVANEHETDLAVNELLIQDQLNHCLYKGYGLLNLGLGYFEDNEESPSAIEHLQLAFAIGERMLLLCRNSHEGVDDFRCEALGLINFSADALAECYEAVEDYDLAAEMDFQASHVRSRLGAFDDGNCNYDTVTMVLADKHRPAMPLSPLERSEVLYHYLLDASNSSDITTAFSFHADYHYRLGILDVERQQFDDAIQHFRDCIAAAEVAEPNDLVRDFDIATLIADAGLRILELRQRLELETDSLVKKIQADIERLEAIDDEAFDDRTLGRIMHEFSILQKPKS